MNELALFAGAGGGILGGKLLGWTTVCAVELDPYAASVLLARQNEGILTPFPIWDDVCTFDGRPWRGFVDVVSGGFPCTDISIAGKGAGLAGDESKLWHEMARIIGEILPDRVFVENSPALTFRGGLRVIGDLAAMGYDCRWGIISAADAIWSAGTPCIDHLRDRIWIAATRANPDGGRRRANTSTGNNTDGQEARRDESNRELGAVRESISDSARPDDHGQRELQPQGSERDIGGWTGDGSCTSPNTAGIGCGSGVLPSGTSPTLAESGNDCAPSANASGEYGEGQFGSVLDAQGREQPSERQIGPQHNVLGWWAVEPDVDRMATGVPARMDRIRCIGMSQVPAVVKLAFETLTS